MKPDRRPANRKNRSPTEQITLILPKELLSVADGLAGAQPIPTSRAAVLRLAVTHGLPVLEKILRNKD